MGILGLNVLLMAVEVWLVVDCMSSLDMEFVSILVSSGLELVDFCDSLLGLLDSLELDWVGAGQSGLDPGMASVFGTSLFAVAAEWPFMAMIWVNSWMTSSGVSTSVLQMVELLCTAADGLVRLLLYLFWDVGQLFIWQFLLGCDLKELGTLGWVCRFVWTV